MFDDLALGAVAVLVVAVALLGAIAGVLLRRALLFRRGISVACALRPVGRAHWQGGVVRFDPDALRAYRVVGVRMRPHTVVGRDLQLGEKRPGDARERARLMTDPVVVPLYPAAAPAVEIALGADAYPGLLAWVEGRPRG